MSIRHFVSHQNLETNRFVLSAALQALRVIACNSGTQMRVRDSSATRIFFKKIRMVQHQTQKITPKF